MSGDRMVGVEGAATLGTVPQTRFVFEYRRPFADD